MKCFYYLLGLTFLFSFLILYSPWTSEPTNNLTFRQSFPLPKEDFCDLSSGHWVRDLRGSQYTNESCSSIPETKNCFKYGRKDTDFLKWKWKPDNCELPRFDPRIFFDIVKGKTMAFIGDSVARNHVESLLCLLSLVEVPLSTYRDDDDRFRTWHFLDNNFTVMVLWSRFLVMGEERIINGKNSDSFDLHLDKLDKNWTSKLPEMDYAIISDVHWFYRKHFLHDNGNMIGCIYCSDPNIKSYTVEFALERVIRLVLNYINECKECKSLVTLLRTGSPAHFENGAWNTGGNCNRTSPFRESEISLEGIEWRLRNMQVDEIKRASKVKKKGKRFAILDVTKAMLMRPDGHPDSHWDDKWMKGYKDCVHWCMPGPIDAWNDFLMAVLKRYAPISIPRKISE